MINAETLPSCQCLPAAVPAPLRLVTGQVDAAQPTINAATQLYPVGSARQQIASGIGDVIFILLCFHEGWVWPGGQQGNPQIYRYVTPRHILLLARFQVNIRPCAPPGRSRLQYLALSTRETIRGPRIFLKKPQQRCRQEGHLGMRELREFK